MEPTTQRIAEGLSGWTDGQNIWKAIKNCPSLEQNVEEAGLGLCCDHRRCKMQIECQSGKCGYEVFTSYRFLLGHLNMTQGIPGTKQWNIQFSKLTEYKQTTVLEIAINKALLVRCDIEIANKGIVLKEVTDKFNKGELVSTNTKQVNNPAIDMKQKLSGINRELGKSINISERDQDDKKAKLKQYGNDDFNDSPMSKFMEVLARAGGSVRPSTAV